MPNDPKTTPASQNHFPAMEVCIGRNHQVSAYNHSGARASHDQQPRCSWKQYETSDGNISNIWQDLEMFGDHLILTDCWNWDEASH